MMRRSGDNGGSTTIPALQRSGTTAAGEGLLRQYEERLRQERERFDAEICVHDLPEIFHYWSNAYLRPMLNDYGYDNIEDFFAREAGSIQPVTDTLEIVSIGSGDCATELEVAKNLDQRGCRRFRFTCLDLSPAALQRAREHAAAAGMEERFRFLEHDFNRGLPPLAFDVAMANQSLHHVVELELLFDAVAQRLPESGCFLVSDMIGRNGHQRWPEARELVDLAWAWLPDRYRYNRQLQREEPRFLDWDCAQEGFEGIRAQDVLPTLLERFQSSVFLAWGNIIDVFIDRGFGHGFAAKTEWDLRFIDQVHAMDESAITDGRIKPTHLLGRFQHRVSGCVHRPGITPMSSVRHVGGTT